MNDICSLEYKPPTEIYIEYSTVTSTWLYQESEWLSTNGSFMPVRTGSIWTHWLTQLGKPRWPQVSRNQRKYGRTSSTIWSLLPLKGSICDEVSTGQQLRNPKIKFATYFPNQEEEHPKHTYISTLVALQAEFMLCHLTLFTTVLSSLLVLEIGVPLCCPSCLTLMALPAQPLGL